jgi:hypothetical protein
VEEIVVAGVTVGVVVDSEEAIEVILIMALLLTLFHTAHFYIVPKINSL